MKPEQKPIDKNVAKAALSSTKKIELSHEQKMTIIKKAHQLLSDKK